MQTIVMPGWEIAEDLSQASAIITLTGNTTIDMLAINVPSGGRFFVESLSARVIDAGSDQITFSLTRNGMALNIGLTDLPAVLFDYTAQFPIQRDTPPGRIVITGKNSNAGDIRAVASIKCYLLREKNKAQDTLRNIYEQSEVQ